MVAPGLRVPTYRMSISTGDPSTGTVELHCPGTYEKFQRTCHRLLAKVLPQGEQSLVCPRCHTRTTFRFEATT